MTKEQVLQEAGGLLEEMRSHRRWLHAHAETGFDLAETKPYVKAALEKMGYSVKECGKAAARWCKRPDQYGMPVYSGRESRQ